MHSTLPVSVCRYALTESLSNGVHQCALAGELSKQSVQQLLFRKLRHLYRNRLDAPSVRHAVVECDLRLEELCSLQLEWDIDGNGLVFDWSMMGLDAVTQNGRIRIRLRAHQYYISSKAFVGRRIPR